VELYPLAQDAHNSPRNPARQAAILAAWSSFGARHLHKMKDPDMKPIRSTLLDHAKLAGLHTLAALSLVVCLMNAGCEQSGYSASSSGNAPAAKAIALAPEKRSADQLLKDMEAAYKKANTYEDAGKVHLHFERDGKAYEDNLDFAVTFVRPNKLRLLCYD